MKKISTLLICCILCLALNNSAKANELPLEQEFQRFTLNDIGNDHSSVIVNLSKNNIQNWIEPKSNQIMWIEDNTIYMIDLGESKDINTINTSENAISKNAIFTIFEKKIENKYGCQADELIEQANNLLKTYAISPLALNKSDQNWDASYTLKLTLTVSYDKTGDTLKLYNATGTYFQSAHNGVSVQNGSLRYTVTGQVYHNGQHVRNGSLNNIYSSNTGNFYNQKLFDNNFEVRSMVLGGVIYSVSATRGVDVSVNVGF